MAIASGDKPGLLMRSLQSGDVDLFHLHHRRHDALRLERIGVIEQLHEQRGNDLSGHAVFILQPGTLVFCAAGRELFPQRIDFFLRLAVHDE